jgi:hypothetical protein
MVYELSITTRLIVAVAEPLTEPAAVTVYAVVV